MLNNYDVNFLDSHQMDNWKVETLHYYIETSQMNDMALHNK